MPTTIETARLRLRPMSTEDVDAMAPMYADPEIMTYLSGVLTRDETIERLALIRSLYDAQGFGILGVVEKVSGALIGRAGLVVQEVEGTRAVEIVYGFVRSAWGHGYATEATLAVRQWAFDHLPDPHFVSLVPSDHVRSIRVAERVGARHDRDVDYQGLRVRVYVHVRPLSR